MSRVSILALIAAVIPGAIRLPMARANWLTSSGSTVAGRRTGFVTGSRSGFGGHAAPVYSALHMLHATSNHAILVGGQMGPACARLGANCHKLKKRGFTIRFDDMADNMYRAPPAHDWKPSATARRPSAFARLPDAKARYHMDALGKMLILVCCHP